MWRLAILAACAALVAAGCGSSSNSSSNNSTDTTEAAPTSTDTKGARVVHYTLDGRDELAIVPKNHGSLLLVLLHGRGAGPQQFISEPLFTGLAHAGSPVVVLLNGGDHSYWHDRSGGKWASMVLNRAIPDAQRRFGTKGKAAIGGISMGGYGALHIASLRPQAFCAVGGHSAALWRNFKATAPGAFDNVDDYRNNNVFTAASKLKKTNVWLDVGDQDPFKDANAELARKVSVPLHVFSGGHNSAYWNGHMRLYLGFYERACA
jgi:enterochelin esterase-like enzyme